MADIPAEALEAPAPIPRTAIAAGGRALVLCRPNADKLTAEDIEREVHRPDFWADVLVVLTAAAPHLVAQAEAERDEAETKLRAEADLVEANAEMAGELAAERDRLAADLLALADDWESRGRSWRAGTLIDLAGPHYAWFAESLRDSLATARRGR